MRLDVALFKSGNRSDEHRTFHNSQGAEVLELLRKFGMDTVGFQSASINITKEPGDQ